MAKLVGSTYGNNNQIEVLRVVDKSKRLFEVRCVICAEDSELYGEGLFTTDGGSISKRIVPCGCNKFAHKTDSQWGTIVKRCAERVGHYLVKYENKEITLCCPSHNYSWTTTNRQHVLRGVKSCPSCISEEKSERLTFGTPQLQDIVDKNMLWSTGTKVIGNSTTGVAYTCGVCSNDEYVKLGLCSGIFKSSVGAIRAGAKSCRCSKVYQWCEESQKHRLSKVLPVGVEILGWDGGYVGSHSRVILKCPTHTAWVTSLGCLLLGSGCPSCAETGYKTTLTGYLYVLRATTENNSFTGYGISNRILPRLREHRSNLRKFGYGIQEVKVFEADGSTVLEVEKAIKSSFKPAGVNVPGFKTESTSGSNYSITVDFIQNQLTERGIKSGYTDFTEFDSQYSAAAC